MLRQTQCLMYILDRFANSEEHVNLTGIKNTPIGHEHSVAQSTLVVNRFMWYNEQIKENTLIL